MGKDKSTSKSQHEQQVDLALGKVSIYGFVLGVLSLIWMLTGFGYYWPIWFMIGWLIGPIALPFFQTMFHTFQAYAKILFERMNTTVSKSEPKKALPPKDDTDSSGA